MPDGTQGIMTQEEFLALVSRHGGVVGVTPIDPEIDDPELPGTLGGIFKIQNPNPRVRYVFRDGTHITIKASEGGEGWQVTDPGTALRAPSGGGTDTFVDTDPLTGARVLRDRQTGEVVRELSGPIPGYQPEGVPRAPQRAPLYPWEQELGELQVQKARQGLTDEFTAARQRHYALIQELHQKVLSGEMDEAEADRIIGLSKANMEATMRGATPFQIEQAERGLEAQQRNFGLQEQQLRQQREQARTGLASDIMGQRLSTGSGLAQGLLSGTGSLYSNILASQRPPYNFNPLLMAKRFVEDMGGGPEMSDLARAILMGALGGG